MSMGGGRKRMCIARSNGVSSLRLVACRGVTSAPINDPANPLLTEPRDEHAQAEAFLQEQGVRHWVID
jgi:hypothetical protein